MLRILIVDDEPPARSRLNRLLKQAGGCEVVGEAGSGEEALEQIADCRPDLLLLDISMPGLDGMALARRLRDQEPSPLVVFCTAWPDQALEAFECDAVDYLVKPVRLERLKTALGKAGRMRGAEAADQDQAFLRSTVGGRTTLVALDDVICLLAEDKYTTVVHGGGKAVINNSLIELEKRFPDRLLRIHRGALVAPGCIRGLDNPPSGPACLVLEGTDVRPEISRRKLSTIRQILREMG